MGLYSQEKGSYHGWLSSTGVTESGTMPALDAAWARSSPGHRDSREKAAAVAGPEMMSLELVQGQGTWTVETDGVITKAGRKQCSNQPLGRVTTPPAQCQGMMGRQGSTPRITRSERRVPWRNQKECKETTCWMKTKHKRALSWNLVGHQTLGQVEKKERCKNSTSQWCSLQHCF